MTHFFPNYSDLDGVTYKFRENIPADHFEVSGPGLRKTSLLISIAAVANVVIGISLAASYGVGSNFFWAGSGDALLGFTLFALAAVDHHLACKKHQNRMLHRCKTIEEYLSLLEGDKDVHYVYRIPNYMNERRKENLDVLLNHTMQDKGRIRFKINGEVYTEDPSLLVVSDPFVIGVWNQTSISYITKILQSRYQLGEGSDYVAVPRPLRSETAGMFCGALDLILDQSKNPPEPIALEMQANYVLNCIPKKGDDLEPIGLYFAAKMRIDFASGDAVISWSSPQKNRPNDF